MWSFLTILLALNALIGLIALEWSWYKFRRFRNPNKDLDILYPAYRRNDSPHWQKWKLYPGAMTLMIPRILIGTILAINLIIWLKLFMLGHTDGNPIVGCRRAILSFFYKMHVHLQCAFTWFTRVKWQRISSEQVGNYEEYLGTVDQQKHYQTESAAIDDRVPKRGPGNPSAIVCNHHGWLEIMSLIASPIHPGFTPKSEVKTLPLLGKLTDGV